MTDFATTLRAEAQELLEKGSQFTPHAIQLRATRLAKGIVELTEPKALPGPTEPLTDRQRDVLAFMIEFHNDNRSFPTVREIMRAFNMKSPNGVMCHLKALIRKKVVGLRPNIARGYYVVGL